MEQHKSIDIEDIKKRQDYWNAFQKGYEEAAEIQNLQTHITLAVQGQVIDKKNILEVACGPGFHQLCLAKTLLQQGATYVLTDNSDAMLERIKTKFTDTKNNFVNVPGNILSIQTDLLAEIGTKDIDIQEQRKKIIEKDTDRCVIGCRAVVEALPFKDSSFDCYIANFVLHIVKDYKLLLQEAFRVLQPKSHAVFTIWGRKENSNLFTISSDILQKHGFGPKEPPAKTGFTLGENLDALRTEFQNQGFTDLKMWYQPNYTLYKDGEEYFYQTTLNYHTNQTYQTMTKQQLEAVKKDMVEEYEKRCGKGVTDPKIFEAIVIVAYKK